MWDVRCEIIWEVPLFLVSGENYSWSSNFKLKLLSYYEEISKLTRKQKSRNKSPFIRHGSLLGHLDGWIGWSARGMSEWLIISWRRLSTVDHRSSINHPSQSQPILCIVIIIRDQLNPYLLHIYEHNLSEEKHLCAVRSWNLGKQTGRFKQNKSIYLYFHA